MSIKLTYDKSAIRAIKYMLNQNFMIVQLTNEAKIMEVNELFLEKFHYTIDDLKMGDYLDYVNGEKAEWQKVWDELWQGKQWNGESCLVTKYGELKWLESTFIPVYNNGNVHQVMTLHVDKTDQKNAEKWKQLAFRHELTNLPNRRKLLTSMDELICRAEQDGTKFAVLFMDINQFKVVNDSYGHTIGDLLLIEIGKRVSKLPSLDERLFHMSGDEFIILLEDSAKLESVIGSIFAQIEKGFELEGHYIEVNISIGVSIYPDDSVNARRLMELADEAMYEAKTKAGNAYEYSRESSLVVMMNKGNLK